MGSEEDTGTAIAGIAVNSSDFRSSALDVDWHVPANGLVESVVVGQTRGWLLGGAVEGTAVDGIL